eukprot:gene8582-9499_t
MPQESPSVLKKSQTALGIHETKKLEYCKNKVDNCEGDQKKLFKVLESLTSRNHDTPYPEHSSVDKLANMFGQFFMEKIDKIGNDITEILQNESLGDHHNYENCETFSHNEFREFAELNSDQIMKLISKCSSKYCQLDPARTSIIKKCLDILLPCITKIINLSLQTGNFPSNWKCSLVIPLLKKVGLDLIFKSYRPVSNPPFISKVVESAAVKQYREYLERNDQMPKRNAAYTEYHSTETISTRVHSDILKNMDNQRVSLLVLLDLSAAFDTLDMNTLQQIFQHKFKISGQVSQWFQSYFTNRKYGVPQGSCAGPVIFLSYLSSLYDLMAQYDVNVGGFADDNELYIFFKPNSKSEAEALNEITSCIAAVRKWMLQHKLKINDDKAEIIIIGGSKQLLKVSLESIVGECSVSPLGHSLPLPGDTRWSSRDTAISVVDSLYESLGTVLYELANENSVNTDTQVSARGLCVQIQHIEFAFLLKFYRKIFAHCPPILTVMQNPTLDATQLLMMLEDFQAFLLNLDSNQVWEDTMILDPEIPSVCQQNGWRGIESAIDSSESWKQKLIAISTEVTQQFTDQLLWRFSNLKKLEWMDLIHPSKFAERRAVSQAKQKDLINDLKNLYPFVVSDPLALEHNLSILYSNSEIGILLEKTVWERDQVVAKKRERRRRLKKANEEHNQNKERERNAIEDADYFERQMESTVEEDLVNEGKPTVQDLLKVIKMAGLQDALPWVMKLLELAATKPLTSVHCERVFSRMKRVVSPSRSTMLQKKRNVDFSPNPQIAFTFTCF